MYVSVYEYMGVCVCRCEYVSVCKYVSVCEYMGVCGSVCREGVCVHVVFQGLPVLRVPR